MTVRAFFVRLALALLLVFSQQQAVLHELQHDFDAVSHKAPVGAGHQDTCLKCLSFAGLDHSPAASAPRFDLPQTRQTVAIAQLPFDRPIPCGSSYDSRAPPQLS